MTPYQALINFVAAHDRRILNDCPHSAHRAPPNYLYEAEQAARLELIDSIQRNTSILAVNEEIIAVASKLKNHAEAYGADQFSKDIIILCNFIMKESNLDTLFQDLLKTSNEICRHYEKSLNVGPPLHKNVTKERFLWNNLRSSIAEIERAYDEPLNSDPEPINLLEAGVLESCRHGTTRNQHCPKCARENDYR